MNKETLHNEIKDQGSKEFIHATTLSNALEAMKAYKNFRKSLSFVVIYDAHGQPVCEADEQVMQIINGLGNGSYSELRSDGLKDVANDIVRKAKDG